MRPCIDCGQPTTGTRCTNHERTRDQARGSSTARGYGQAHRRLRAQYQRRMDNGEPFTCWRCDGTIDPRHWHLGHDDVDRSRYRGPECIPCNDATMGRIAPDA